MSTRATLAVVTLLVLIITCCDWNVEMDDAYIHFTYARNIATGHGYVFKPGERILGTTSPLYTLVLAALYRLLHPLPFVTLPGIGHLLWAAGLWLTAFLGMKILSEAGLPRAAILYPLLILANPLHGQAIGMETFLTLPLEM